jgi:hypothetical protein
MSRSGNNFYMMYSLEVENALDRIADHFPDVRKMISYETKAIF